MNRRSQAEQVGAAVPRSRLHPAVLAWTEARRRRTPWGIALSGGADSVALLLLVWAHWPERRADLVVLHFNHRLRGRAADADERFCRQLCRGLGVSLRVGRWRRPPSGASEAEARAARHAFFARELERAGSRVLWLAHQQDDVAETLLMRLGRGSGAAGMSAPRPVQEFSSRLVYLRPLLPLRRRDLVAALRRAGVAWREDESNRQPAHLRNRMRRSVLPAWERASRRDAVAGAALTRELLAEDDRALELWTERSGALAGKTLRLDRIHDLPRAVLRRLLHRWLAAVRPRTDLSRQGFEVLLAAVERGSPAKVSVGDGLAELRAGVWRFRRMR